MSELSADSPEAAAITSAAELWTAFTSRAGLKTGRRRGGAADYDTELIGAVRGALEVPDGA